MAQGSFASALRRNRDLLAKARVVYIATIRKNGNQGKAVPVWFTAAPDDTLLIQSAASGWMARRIRRGSPVIVWIGRRKGPAFIGKAEISADPEVLRRIIEDYPRRYLLVRLGFHRPSRSMFDQGRIVAFRITALRQLPSRFVSHPGMLAPSTEPSPACDPSPGVMRKRHDVIWKKAANLLSTSRFLLAGFWLAAYAAGDRHPGLLGPIALMAAASDFADGYMARQAGSPDRFGRWLDNIADVTFILVALCCEARAGSIPAYLPLLISLCFTQYALDSVLILYSPVPVASRLGHWAGAFNYVLVLTLAFAPPPALPGRLLSRAAPLIGIFYLAAIVERTINYRRSRALPRST
jgi:phosphatidylglycerophosphate synthase